MRHRSVIHCCSLLVCRAFASLLGLWVAAVSAGCSARSTIHLHPEVDADMVFHDRSQMECSICLAVHNTFCDSLLPDGISPLYFTLGERSRSIVLAGLSKHMVQALSGLG